MLDIFNIADTSNNSRVFYTNGGGGLNTTSWQTWHKPRNAKFIQMLLVGGGGGGGAGASQVLNTSTGGGGGGGGAFSVGYFPANLLPDILYVQVGPGGAGGISGGSGAGSGSLSYVSLQPNLTIQNLVLVNGGGPGGPASPGGTSTGGSAGTAGTVFVQTNRLSSYLGIVNYSAGLVGQTGGVGGSTLANVNYTLPFGMGGMGGAGNTVAGTPNTTGIITTGADTLTPLPNVSGGTSGTLGTAGQNGYICGVPSSSFSTNLPFYNSAGAGGGQSSSGVGGNGGDGGFGCGGGGGGSSNNGSGGGRGGKGGDGLVVITCW
jgi:hypothetical protein